MVFSSTKLQNYVPIFDHHAFNFTTIIGYTNTPVFKVNSPQPLIRVLVHFGQSEYVVAADELVGPPSPKGYVRQLDLIKEFVMKCIVKFTSIH